MNGITPPHPDINPKCDVALPTSIATRQTLKVSLLFLHQVQQDINPKGVVPPINPKGLVALNKSVRLVSLN